MVYETRFARCMGFSLEEAVEGEGGKELDVTVLTGKRVGKDSGIRSEGETCESAK